MTTRVDIDDTYRQPPRRGSLDVLAMVKGGGLFRYRSQRDRIIEGRLRDALMWSGGFLCGVLALAAAVVVAVGWRAVT